MSIAQSILAHPEALAKAGGGGGGAKEQALSGLGWVVGNPVSKAVLGGLSVLDYPRAAVVSGVRELFDTQAMEELNKAIAKLPGVEYSPIQAEDAEASWGDWWRQTKEHAGFGDLIVEPAMGAEGTDRNIWARRLMGFAGDVAADPFSYLSLGTGAATGVAARANYINKLRAAQQGAAANIIRKEAWLATSGAKGAAREAAEASLKAARQRAELFGGDEALELIGRRGVNVATPAQQVAMGLDPAGLRVGGMFGGGRGVPLPGTGGLGRGAARVTGPVKEMIGTSALGRGARALTTKTGVFDQDLRPAINRIVTGEGGDLHEALNAMRINELGRIAGGGYRTKGRRELSRWLKEIKDYDEPTRKELIREAEEDGVQNVMTKFGPRMAEVAKSVGVDIPKLEGDYVVPHVMSRAAYVFFNKLRRGGDPLVADFSKALGWKTDDLLAESGFLQRRALRPNADGTPLKLKIGGEVVEIHKGSINELENKLGGILRAHGFEGDLYESSPTEAWLRYIEGMRRDVAKRAAFGEGADIGMAGLQRAGLKPPDWDPAGGRKLMATDAAGNLVDPFSAPPGVAPEGARYAVTENPIPRPADTAVFEMVEDPRAEAKRLREFSKKGKTGREQRKLLAELEEAANAERAAIAGTYDKAAQEAWEEIQAARVATAAETASAGATVASLHETVQRQQALRERIISEISDTEAEIRRLQSRIGQITATAGKRARGRGEKLSKKLLDELDAATQRIDDLQIEREAALSVTDEQMEAAWKRVEGWSDRRQRLHLRDLKNRITRTEPRKFRGSKVRYDEAVEEARLARRARGWVEEEDFMAADATMKNERIRQSYADARRKITAIDDERKLASAEAQRLDNEAQELRRQAASGTGKMPEKRQNALNKQADDLERQAREQRTTAYMKTIERQNAEEALGKHQFAKANRTVERWHKQNDDIAAGKGSSLLGEYDVAAARSQYEDDVREMHAFKAAMDLKKQQGRVPPTAAERIEAEAATATERLKAEPLQEFMTAENKLAVLEDDIRAAVKEKPAKTHRTRPLRWQKNSPGSYTAENGDLSVTLEKIPEGWSARYSDPKIESTTHRTFTEAKLAAEKATAETPEYRAWRTRLEGLRAERDEAKRFVQQHPARGETIRVHERQAQKTDLLRQQEREVAAANKFLDSEQAQQWRRADARAAGLRGRVNAAKPTRAGKTPAQFRQAMAEWRETAAAAQQALDRTDAWLARNADLGQRYREAERTVAQGMARIEKMAPELPRPGAHPEMARIERQEQQRLQDVIGADIPGRNVEQTYEAKIAGAKAEEAGRLRRVGGQEMGEVVDTGQAQLDEAAQRLRSPEAQQVTTNRERLAQIEADLAKPKPKRITARHRERWAELRKEHRVLRQWFRDNAALTEQLRADQDLLGRAGLQGPTPTGEQLQRPVATMGESQAGITLEEAAAARPKIQETRQAIEANRERVVELQQTLHEVDEEVAFMQDAYFDARNDLPAAINNHRQFEQRMQGLERPRKMEDVAGKRGGQPYSPALKAVKEGTATPFEAQPMHRVVEDMNALIAADPMNSDEQINRLKAVAASTEQGLAKVTETDITANDVDRILKQANNGKLAAPLKAQVKSGLSYVWEGGDVIISDKARAMYYNITKTVESNRFGRALTLFTDFFKTYATLSPGFHVRNALSAIFMNASEGVKIGTQIEAVRSWRQYMRQRDPTEWLENQPPHIRDAYHAVFASGTGGQFLESGVAEARGGRRFMDRALSNRATRASQWLGQWVEGPARLALALDSTMAGATAIDALQRVTRVHFDYSQVSKFDETMKRWIPFWTFMSRNIPLQFTQMWTKPKTYLRFQSFARNFSVEPPEFFPEYIEDLGGFDTGVRTPGWMEKIPLASAAAGMPVALQADLPHMRLREDLQRTARALSGDNPGQMFSDLNPFYTAPFEWATGTDIYTNKKYGPTDVSKARGLGVPIAAIMSMVGGAKRGPNGEMYFDDKTWNAIQSLIPPLERQSRLLPNLLMEGTAGGKKERGFESYARFLGAPIRTISEAQMRSEQANRYYNVADYLKQQQAMGG